MTKRSGKAEPTQKRLSPDWPVWGEKLAACLARLEEDQCLIISPKHGNRYIQFAGQGSFGMRVETSSNEYLAESEKLSSSQIASLLKAGWHKPTGKPAAATPERDPSGSPNFFRDVSTPVPVKDVADLAVRTFAEILKIPYPGLLHYRAFEIGGGPLDLPDLGLKRAREDLHGKRGKDLRALLLDTIREATGLTDLAFDNQGYIQMRHGKATLFVSIEETMSCVRIHALLLDGVEEQPGLYERLNELNMHSTLLRFAYRNDVLIATADIDVGHHFSRKQVAQVFHYCAQVADDLSPSLQAELGGHTSFPDLPPNLVKH